MKVSGGGRCNVTHACFDPKLLIKNYPRGEKELLGPFNRFGPKDTIDWFESKGVYLKAEGDGRMFPTTDSSETIINCFLSTAEKLGVEIHTQQKIESIEKVNDEFHLKMKDASLIKCEKLILATGNSSKGHIWAKELGHTIQEPVPSLFTFNVPASPLSNLSGISFEDVSVEICKSSFSQSGPLLITHFGFSGPAILKLSAWAARLLNKKEYSFEIKINWTKDHSLDQITQKLLKLKKNHQSKTLLSENIFKLPKNFWRLALRRLKIQDDKRLNDLTSKEINELSKLLFCDNFKVKGKTTNKEEFVTCGGVTLKEVNFKTMESKICKGLFFAGEILDIDGVTGGFNFQNAWTSAFLAGMPAS